MFESLELRKLRAIRLRRILRLLSANKDTTREKSLRKHEMRNYFNLKFGLKLKTRSRKNYNSLPFFYSQETFSQHGLVLGRKKYTRLYLGQSADAFEHLFVCGAVDKMS